MAVPDRWGVVRHLACGWTSVTLQWHGSRLSHSPLFEAIGGFILFSSLLLRCYLLLLSSSCHFLFSSLIFRPATQFLFNSRSQQDLPFLQIHSTGQSICLLVPHVNVHNSHTPIMEETARRPRPRWMLHIQAQFWRFLMQIGMFMHRLAPPRPPPPTFTRTIKPTVAADKRGHITLNFYVPRDYKMQQQLHRKTHPVVINFHGGGFTLGHATDDARWCRVLVEELNAVVVSVDYRLAPEHPFPTAVEDGVDAILWVAEHADELTIDISKIVVSGFSSGGNMAFTVPLRLQEELQNEMAAGEERRESVLLNVRPPLLKALSEGRILSSQNQCISVKTVVAWYPSTDYTRTRDERRATQAERLDQQLPAVFTELFDESYLQPPTMDKSNPYLSPGVAPEHMLASLPQDIIMFTSEWDMLLKEGEDFRDRLLKLGKTVHYFMVPGVPHGWDKAPNPLRETPGVNTWYLKACKQLRKVLNVGFSTRRFSGFSLRDRRLSISTVSARKSGDRDLIMQNSSDTTNTTVTTETDLKMGSSS